MAEAAAALAHAQEVSGLATQLAEVRGQWELDVARLQDRLNAVMGASAAETSRLTRQLAQACGAAEALEAQLHLSRGSAAASVQAAAREVDRLRGALSSAEAELRALRSVMADVSAATASRLVGAAKQQELAEAASYSAPHVPSAHQLASGEQGAGGVSSGAVPEAGAGAVGEAVCMCLI